MNAPTQPRMNASLAIAFILVFIVSLAWPMYLSGQVLAFYDTRSYLRGGDKIWDVLLQLFAALAPESPVANGTAIGAAPAETLTVNQEGKNVTGRSFPYSAFSYVAFRAGGALGIALAQAAITTLMIGLMVTRDARRSPYTLVAGGLFLATLTGLPWYTTFLMPDIFGGFVVLFGVLLVRDIDDMGFWTTLLLLALAAFAATAHYGNMPLMAGIVLTALAVRLFRGRLTWKAALVGFFALAAAPAANLGASAVVLDEASVAPKRVPILLARSLDDGPALWYLQDVCPEADLGLCEAYGDNISADTGEFLWSDEGVMALPSDLLDRIRDEEYQVVFAAFLRYPAAQLNSFFGHALQQLYRVGVEEMAVADGMGADFEPSITHAGPLRVLQDAFDKIIPVVTAASALAFVGLILTFGLTARWADMLVVFALGYAGNALIYGGLSAPIDRYQGRTAWIIPLLLIIFLAEKLAERRRTRLAYKLS